MSDQRTLNKTIEFVEVDHSVQRKARPRVRLKLTIEFERFKWLFGKKIFFVTIPTSPFFQEIYSRLKFSWTLHYIGFIYVFALKALNYGYSNDYLFEQFIWFKLEIIKTEWTDKLSVIILQSFKWHWIIEVRDERTRTKVRVWIQVRS